MGSQVVGLAVCLYLNFLEIVYCLLLLPDLTLIDIEGALDA